MSIGHLEKYSAFGRTAATGHTEGRPDAIRDFDDEDRFAKSKNLGDPLPRLESIVDWQVFRPLLRVIHHKQRKRNAVRRDADVEEADAAIAVPFRRSNGILGPGSAVVPALPAAVAGRNGAGRQDAI